jgi:hypothetical protein
MTNKEKEFFIILNGWKKKDDWFYIDDDPSSHVIVGPFTLSQAYNKSRMGINSFNDHANERIEYYRDRPKSICNWQVLSKLSIDL